MENLEKTIAENLARCRTMAGYTQAELADMINYSDKSVSKWERGEGLPDVVVLVRLAEIYGVTVNDLIAQNKPMPKIGIKRQTRLLITVLSVLLVWLTASITFVVLYNVPVCASFAPLCFLYAVPASGIVLIVFSALWGSTLQTLISCSVVVWGGAVSASTTVAILEFWHMAIVAGVIQVLLVFGFFLQMTLSHKSH